MPSICDLLATTLALSDFYLVNRQRDKAEELAYQAMTASDEWGHQGWIARTVNRSLSSSPSSLNIA